MQGEDLLARFRYGLSEALAASEAEEPMFKGKVDDAKRRQRDEEVSLLNGIGKAFADTEAVWKPYAGL